MERLDCEVIQYILYCSRCLFDVQVLLAERQYREARELLQAALDVCGKR